MLKDKRGLSDLVLVPVQQQLIMMRRKKKERKGYKDLQSN